MNRDNIKIIAGLPNLASESKRKAIDVKKSIKNLVRLYEIIKCWYTFERRLSTLYKSMKSYSIEFFASMTLCFDFGAQIGEAW